MNQHWHDQRSLQGIVMAPRVTLENDDDGDNNPDDIDADERLPEEKLNTMALRMAFFYRVMNGFGALAFAWATVVLLGGYATLIKQKDFWFVTIIVFMEATWRFII
uniref:Uncharacterized protein n=1 Tax=Oryza punctata TaxID=4537 RepID=A0A0E0JJM4_ORYPU